MCSDALQVKCEVAYVLSILSQAPDGHMCQDESTARITVTRHAHRTRQTDHCHGMVWYPPTCFEINEFTISEVERTKWRQRLYDSYNTVLAAGFQPPAQAESAQSAAAQGKCAGSHLGKKWCSVCLDSLRSRQFMLLIHTHMHDPPECCQGPCRQPLGERWNAQRAEAGQLSDHRQQLGTSCRGTADRQARQAARQAPEILWTMLASKCTLPHEPYVLCQSANNTLECSVANMAHMLRLQLYDATLHQNQFTILTT